MTNVFNSATEVVKADDNKDYRNNSSDKRVHEYDKILHEDLIPL